MVDSGAEESVCPWEWGERLFGTQHSKEHMQFKNASGGNIEHWGMREVKVTSTKIYKLFASISILVWDSIV
jgi:hypothetical protein